MLENLKGVTTTSLLISKKPKTISPGNYLVILSHNGFANMSQIAFFTMSGWDGSIQPGHENKFYECTNLISNNPQDNRAYQICFNPVTCQIKLRDNYPDNRYILLVKFTHVN